MKIGNDDDLVVYWVSNEMVKSGTPQIHQTFLRDFT
jgi:hypothetical protein